MIRYFPSERTTKGYRGKPGDADSHPHANICHEGDRQEVPDSLSLVVMASSPILRFVAFLLQFCFWMQAQILQSLMERTVDTATIRFYRLLRFFSHLRGFVFATEFVEDIRFNAP